MNPAGLQGAAAEDDPPVRAHEALGGQCPSPAVKAAAHLDVGQNQWDPILG